MGLFTRQQPFRLRISKQRLGDIIHGRMTSAGIELHRQGGLHFADPQYGTVTPGEAQDALFKARAGFVPRLRDCDDFAKKAAAAMVDMQQDGRFAGSPAAFGTLWTMEHALNIFATCAKQTAPVDLMLVDNDGTLRPIAWLKGRTVMLCVI